MKGEHNFPDIALYPNIAQTTSPRPWRTSEDGLIPMEIWSVNGERVACGVRPEDATLIIDAVNKYDEVAKQNAESNDVKQYASLGQARREERYRKALAKECQDLRSKCDQFRNIVKRLGDKLQEIIDVATDKVTTDCLLDEALIREARDVIGENESDDIDLKNLT